ncbi:MAG: hypothetical protein IT317_03400 [Anaerolineales bacterium]|nr:hypothetical protein [Anaerolineales bacterium]
MTQNLMATAAPLRLSVAWWIVLLGLSATLSLNGVLPLLRAGVGEFTPFHTHRLVGGTPAARAWLLTYHTHNPTPAPAPAAPNAASAAPTLTNVSNSLADLLSLAAGGPALLGAGDWPPPWLPPALWALLLPATLFRLGRAAPRPERPPRPA